MMVRTVPFNDTSRVYKRHKVALDAIITDVAGSGWWLLGKHTEHFSKAFSEYCGVEFCLPVANGSDALEMALRAVLSVDCEAEQEVITVANAGGYSSIACTLVGATPIYADVDEHSLLLSMESLKNCLGSNVKAVIVTHLFGGAVDVFQVRKTLVDNGYGHVVIIEDCAQAHGAKVGDQRVGSMGDLATFSFYPTKNLGAMGDGGAIVTSDKSVFAHLKQLHQYGWGSKYQISIPCGRNSRMDEIQAAILMVLLPFLDSDNKKRADIYGKYRQAANSNLSFLNHDSTDYVGHLAVIRSSRRNDFIAYMKEQGIGVDVHYPILDHEQEGWQSLNKKIDPISQLLVSKSAVNEIVTLPCFPSMSDEEITYVCEALSRWSDS
ncbi:DegT/DnrJ/EryC1/StrS family aminotransferase [Vibrio echinoideorum]|uniref:DegT/DnrJ/EryC1/StrS family aminotransferase n=1 Tax=Vibrio echinoideorum TaxID=2100116 RepID=UPI00354DD153